MKSSRGFVWLPVLLIILGVLVLSGGAYFVVHQNSQPQTPISQEQTTTPPTTTTPTSAPTQTKSPSSGSVSVPGMSKYTDADFGFSFWYPSSSTITPIHSTPANITDGTGGGTFKKNLVIFVGGQSTEIDIVEMQSDTRFFDLWIDKYTTERFYFDRSTHTWMHVLVGADGWPAEVSTNTMGGLHMLSFNFVPSTNNQVIPLSANAFLYISNVDKKMNILPLTKTIVATDPSVATPVSAAEQIATIQAEQKAYAGQ